ncbi:MAG: MFS transporter [Ignavibacteria bacterium]|jgi:MFS family permease|nr:MFS transporter [Ignavibacteria bacterium]MCU7502156.1 MFS transporter [Ignavibacteria bacterium]MCU7515558.1 MFS transporter [Ignavibacteria bacterium]
MAEATTLEKPRRFTALKHRNFTLLWTGLIVSNAGTWMQNVAQGWLVLQLTNSPLWLGLLGLSFALPMIILPFLGGMTVDRMNRIRLLYVTQAGMMLTAFILSALTWLHMVTVYHILAASFISAAFLAFDNPARQALVPDLVPREDLLNALSLNSATFTGAALIGPAVAGALLGILGAGSLFFINGLSFLAVLFALASMREVPTHSGSKTTSLKKSALAGLSYAWKSRFILSLLALSTVTAIFGRSYQNLLPIFARDVWRAGAGGYGVLLSSSGGGALLGAFALASLNNIRRPGLVLVISGLVFSISIILFAESQSLVLGIIFIFINGISATAVGTIIATFIQVTVPNELRGRIISLYTITLIGLPALGSLGSGAVAELLGGIQGAPRAVLIGGIIAGVIIVFTAPMFWRRVMSRDEK